MVRSRLGPACWLAAILGLAAGWSAWALLPPGERPAQGGATMLGLWLATAIVAAGAVRRRPAPPAFDARYLPMLSLAASLPLALIPLTGVSDTVTAWILGSATMGVLPLGSGLAGDLATS